MREKEARTVIIVGKNISKKASGRNLIKRRIRAIVRTSFQKTEKGIVIIARPGAEKLTFEELQTEIEDKLKKHG